MVAGTQQAQAARSLADHSPTKQVNVKGVPVHLAERVREFAFARRRNCNEVWIEALESYLTSQSRPPTQLEFGFDARHHATRLPHRLWPRFHFRFVDLFAGIGGFRIGLERLLGECVFSSERDPHCQRTYASWFGEVPAGDINGIDPGDIPDHDVLAAGFPCQPFSIAGVSKKRSLGQPDGFRCERQGNLFFKICEIVKAKRPPVLILENVKNLKSHDQGRTWKVIHDELSRGLDYEVHHKIIDAADYVPQHRERIFIVCFDRALFGDLAKAYQFPTPPRSRPRLNEILEQSPPRECVLTDHLWSYLQRYAEKHRAKGNGFGFGLVDPGDPEVITRTLSARYHKDGSEILIDRGRGRNPRRLSPFECARLMGFDDKVPDPSAIVVSNTQAYRQFGNAVVPLVVEAVAGEALRVIDRLQTLERRRCTVGGHSAGARGSRIARSTEFANVASCGRRPCANGVAV